MRAIQITEPGRFRIVDTPEPAAGPGEVLIAVQACVTCPHWDTTIFRGVDIFERPGHPKYPIPVGYPGHEVSGRVEAVGEGVTSLQVGDRVATLKAGGESNPGFYSELISRPAEMVTRIPDNTSYEAAASMEMAYHMSPYVRALGDVAGKRVGIVGLGPAGIIAMQMVRAEGAGAVVAIDLVPERLELARTLGADQVVRIEPGTPSAALEREPLQASIDCTGAGAGMQVALDYTVDGPVSPFGVIHGEAIYTTRHWRNRTAIAQRVAPAALDAAYVTGLWAAEKLNTEVLIGARLPFERYDEGVQLLLAKQALKICYLPQGA